MPGKLHVFHLRSIFFCVLVMACWVWLNARPTQIIGGGIFDPWVGMTAKFGLPLTVVYCNWSAKRVWDEEAGVYIDPSYSYWQRVPIPPNAEWSEVQVIPLLADIAVAVLLCLWSLIGFEIISRRLMERFRSPDCS